ncbi:MAG TPA: bifunctional serine/threonine-protein kinase/formylglycine-generating enzyme family protein [Arenimonas sp.]|uniref:bifunctional serine/threonine-protein kinase/formylglycine-generating enzyme family protein n=1 Tax=Arenimonas sp. TaxID=1872635 RepID=UPI002B75C7C3|nr:bifunctional serine/threonine-protein kinase/formylglycine-generating enzyme family protein [Arenimonas sp.]HMB57604.1 bifunctional serine/threonine-protein kinase/formylglycine-generating enzyme family protein [Arenimonas sp.]
MQSEELSPEELSALLTSYMPEIPGYRVMRRIGKGGMSYVYLGVQESLDRQVAVKVMSPEALTDEKSKQRFEQEARTIAKLEHPCIVGIHEVGRTPQGLLYYVLPYLAKGHLGQRDFTNDEGRITEVLRSLLSALEYAHARGIVHRDVKAENVLFDNADRPLLTDFGIALSKRDSTRITSAGLAVGSGGYMAPEQARGEAVDGRADLYSVGVLAYELLTGRLPYLSSDPLALALMHAQDPVPRLPAEKKHWQPFLDRAMAKAPDNRYRNAQQMQSALSQVATRERGPGDSQGNAASTAAVARPWLKPALFGLFSVMVIALVAFALRPKPETAHKPPDFFTSQDEKAGAAKPETATVVGETPAPTAATAPTTPATTTEAAASTPVAPPPAPAALPPPPPPATTTAAASASPFANVKAAVTVTPLDYDPAIAGARELSAARREIKQNRLSTPADDNAVDSLLAAHKLAPKNADVAKLSDEVLAGLGKSVLDAVKASHDDAAKLAYQRAGKFAKDGGRLNSESWKNLHIALPPLLIARLEKDTKAFNAAGITRTKTLAGVLEIAQSELEPAWSHANTNVLPKPGDLIAKGNGPTLVLATLPSETRPGLAVMRAEVSRGDYAVFANATHRAASRCANARNALATLFGSKRSWSSPGFPQSDNHPVVCVSESDARAYAEWLSQRTGERYRLPTLGEWRGFNDYRSGDACRSGQIDCGAKGTAPGSSFAPSPLGIHDLHGNASEWLGDAAGANRYVVAGLSWRDPASAAPGRSSVEAGDKGYDEVGFRLVREIPASELTKP